MTKLQARIISTMPFTLLGVGMALMNESTLRESIGVVLITTAIGFIVGHSFFRI